MKHLFILPCILLAFKGCCQTRVSSGVKQDSNSIYFQERLKEYKIDKCLADLLTDVVKLDSSQLRFPANKFYYDLTFDNRGDYRFMSIIPSRWEKSGTLDFKGVVKVEHMSFLCRGNFREDPLFTQTKNDIELLLIKPKTYQYDSVDVNIEAFTWKPTLAGKYSFCSGVPIDLYILVGQKLKDFDTKVNDD